MSTSIIPQQARDPRFLAGGDLRSTEAARAAGMPVERRNRRGHLRFAAKGVAGHLQTMEASLPGLAVENISLGGLFVRSASPLPVGAAVAVQLVRPGLKRAIQLTGRVISAVSAAEARARGSIAGMGIALDALDGETSLRLHALIDDLAAIAHVERRPAPVAEPPAAPLPTPAAPMPLPAVLAPPAPTPTMPDPRLAQLEAEVAQLRKELLRRNRTIGELATRLGRHESI